MKNGRTLCATVLAMVLLVVVGAAARSKDSKNVSLRHDVTVAGSRLTQGTYGLEWRAHDTSATVSFSHGSKVVATVEGKVVERSTTYPADEVVYSESANGALAIREIRFKGLSEVIAFN
jgi:hypothetical protein